MEDKNVLVIGVNRYSFPNRETGEIIQGTKVHYVDLDATNDADSRGLFATTSNLPYGDFDRFDAVPGIYTINMTIDLSKKKPQVKVKGFTFQESFNLGA